MIRRPPRSTQSRSSAASDVYKRQDQGEGDHTPGFIKRGQQPDTGYGADQVGAGITQHRPLTQGVGQAKENRAEEDPGQLQRGQGPGAETKTGTEQHQGLLGPARAGVEQIEQISGQDQQGDVGQVAAGLAAGAADDVGGDRQGADRLDRAGREPAGRQRTQVAAPTARRAGLATAAEGIDEEAQEDDAQQVDDPAAQVGVEQVEIGALVDESQRCEGDQGGGGEDRAEREGDRGATVVLAQMTGLAQAAHAGLALSLLIALVVL